MSDRIEQAAQILRAHRIECTGVGEVTCACRNPSDWMSPGAYFRHVAEALADVGIIRSPMSDPIEQAVREAINELENLISRYYTIAHPENTMRVLGLLWGDQQRIAGYLREALDRDASPRRDDEASAAIDRVRALHYPNTTFGICVEDGDRWPCPTIRTLDEDPT